MSFPDYYAILGVPRFYATQDEIRSAYLKQVRYFHPDAGNVPPEVAKTQTQTLNLIYSVLKDPQKKRTYDGNLAEELEKREKNQQQQQATAPVEKAKKKRDIAPVICAVAAVLIMIACTIYALNINNGVKEPIVNTPAPIATPKPTIAPAPDKTESNYEEAKRKLEEKYGLTTPTPTPKPLPENGYILYPSSLGFPEDGSGLLTITASDDKHYCIKLRNIYTGDTEIIFFVQAGMSVDVNVPLGEYELLYACGDEWYGYLKLFGDETSYYRADDTFLFEDYGDSVTWWEVELYLQYGGNLDTDEIDESEF